MPIYYAVIPGLEEHAAEIDAPDKDKGRTVYLDYLTEIGKISHGEKGPVRRKIVIDRMDPGQELWTEVRLSYSRSRSPLVGTTEYRDLPSSKEVSSTGPRETTKEDYSDGSDDQSVEGPDWEYSFEEEEILDPVDYEREISKAVSPIVPKAGQNTLTGIGKRIPIMEVSRTPGGTRR